MNRKFFFLCYKVEAQLENIAVRAQKELILLHREDADTPRRTADWLNARGWCSSHHHIRCPKRVFSRKSKEKSVSINQEAKQNSVRTLVYLEIGTSV